MTDKVINMLKYIHDNKQNLLQFTYGIIKNQEMSEDVLHVVIISVIKNGDQLEDMSKMKSWIRTSTFNAALRHYNLNKRYVNLYDDCGESDYDDDDFHYSKSNLGYNPNDLDYMKRDLDHDSSNNIIGHDYTEELLSQYQLIERMKDKIETLTKQQKIVIKKILDNPDDSMAQLARISGVSENTFKSHYRYALLALKERMKHCG